MSLDLDGYAVLRTIGSKPALFPSLAADAKKAARTLVAKQMRAKATDLKALKDIRKALGEDNFSLLIDGMTDPQVKSLVGRFDKYHPDLKTSTAAWRRGHLDALARGEVKPAEKPPPKRRQPAKKAKKARQEDDAGLFGTAMDAERKRR